ncbi:GlsB/YeaQ/YmgE family stress response membrane protein [Methylophilus sp.]
MKGDGYGLIWDLILGIAGAVVGSWLFGLLGLSASGGLIGSIVVATIGAIFLIFLSRALRKG